MIDLEWKESFDLNGKKTWSAGDRKIFQLADGFVISEDEMWLPGHFETLEAAKAAFDD